MHTDREATIDYNLKFRFDIRPNDSLRCPEQNLKLTVVRNLLDGFSSFLYGSRIPHIVSGLFE